MLPFPAFRGPAMAKEWYERATARRPRRPAVAGRPIYARAMDDAVPAAPRVIPGLTPPENPLDRAVRRIWAIETLLNGLTAAIVAAVGAWLLIAFTAIPPALPVAGVAAVIIVAAAATLWVPRVAYRHYRWEVTDAGLIVQRGWLLREFIAVPHTRIQTVETRRGPLERLVDLASAGVSTAAGEAVRIPGLTAATAAQLQAELSARTGRGEGA